MASFKHPTFQDRAGQAAAEKQKALEQLRLRPEPAEELVAERRAASARKEAINAEKASAKKAAASAAAQSKAQAKAKAATRTVTEADRKAARDARYAARKARQKR